VVHIDFNVCFDKGMRLRVPEAVPFRLTRTLRAPLGPLGVDGAFVHACARTLAALRAATAPLLLPLLRSFVDDPIVEWRTATREDAYVSADARVR
jgi:serine/threonine-protein kinase SMG1